MVKSQTLILGEGRQYILEPLIFTRENQGPTTFEIQLDIQDYDCYSEPFYLNVINSDGNGAGSVTSAIISIDSEVIFSQSDFNKKVRDLRSKVYILPNSVISIELRGKPGTYITLSIEGFYNDCEWEYLYGGSNSEDVSSMVQTPD